MLVLSRKPNESIIIGNNIEVKVVEVRGEQVKLGITAPRDIPVHRKEIFDSIQEQNKNAAQTNPSNLDKLSSLFKKKKETS
jgi:carbon storage regulator